MSSTAEPAKGEGESLFCDFSVTLGFDNFDKRPLTLVTWRCSLCGENGREFVPMQAHAQEHVGAS